ncbi:DUF1801 domain-containing protein [Aliiroseovarius sp. S253]|uniref:DUF1801 domain-containing protein n=1 Tax=Aliiroseovarius sp. S253 TaxID=3415133 RepID=UPI003C7CE074
MTKATDNIDSYIGSGSAEAAPLLSELRAFIHATLPGAAEKMQYGVPTFLNAHGVPVIYLYGSKKGQVNFGFLKSSELSDPDSVLRGSGTPSKHIPIFSGKPINKDMLISFIQQCEQLKA